MNKSLRKRMSRLKIFKNILTPETADAKKQTFQAIPLQRALLRTYFV